MNIVSYELFLRFLADGTLVIILLLGGTTLLSSLWGRRLLDIAPYAIMAGMTSLLVGKLISLIYQPAVARPFLELGVQPGAAYIDNPGFPSDHALLGTVVVMAAIVLVKKRWLSIVLIGLLALMSVARVAALVHTPLDVVGGLLAGLVGGLWYMAMTRRDN